MNKYTENHVTLYYIDDVQYVAVDEGTKKVIQISNKAKTEWVN